MSAVVEVATPVSLDNAIAAYEREDFATALDCFRSLAGRDDRVAQFYLGRMFAMGEGLVQDHAAAAAWYLKSAEQGYFKAQHNLAIALELGTGVSRDLAVAAVWMRRAAEQGSSRSQFRLGLTYLHGMGVLQNYAEAAAWLRKAADQENGDAEYMLGHLYLDGKGVSQDNAEAVGLFCKAANRGVIKAQCALATMYMFGIGRAQDYSEALAWYRRAAEQNDPDALRGLGVMYEEGHGVPADAAKALSCYRQAADLGDARAQAILGHKYQFGAGVPQDPAAAIELYRKAADQGHAEAQYAMGGIYADAIGVPRDYVEAAKWFRKAADQGFAKAQFNLGLAFLHAQGVPQDLSAALYWFREAGDRGDSKAQDSLGLMYLRGEGTTQDYAMAAFWFGKAANQGNTRSQCFLGHMYLRGDGVPQDYLNAYLWLTLAKAGAGKFEARETLEAIDEALAATARQLTASELAEAQELVRQWKPKSAAQSVNEAAFAAMRAWQRSDIVLAAYSSLGADEWRGERAFAGGSIVFPDAGRAATLAAEARQAPEAGRSPATIIPLLDEALRLNYPDAIDRDVAVTRSEIYAKAGVDEPLRAIELYNIGVSLARVKLWREAAFVYQAAADLDPLFAWHLNNLAWMASTAPDVRAHAGQYSVVAATRACEISGWACWCFIGTLAAAFARAGDFRRAAEWQRISLRLAPEREKAEAQEVLRQFETGEAHVDHDRKPAVGGPGPSDEKLAQIDVEALLSRAKELIGTSRHSVQ